MTDVPPPESPKPPRGRPRRQKGFDDEAVLSDEEVARRVDVRGGAGPRAPIERAAVRAPRAPTRRTERTGARDSLLLIGLVIVGLVAVRLFLPDGPLTASATQSPGATQAAVVTTGPSAAATSAPTGGLITLPPTPFVPTASPAELTAPPITPAPTAAAPTPTLKPGQTPVPTPRPTKTPAPPPSNTPGTTPPAGTAFVNVSVLVINDDGGDASASAWTITATSDGTATPSSFTGNRTVTVTAGKAYNVAPGTGPSGYKATRSAPCSSGTGLVAGTTVSCQISENDIKPTVTVYTIVDGGSQSPADWNVTVTGTDVVPGAFSGKSGGQDVSLNANAPFSVSQTNANDQDYTLDTTGTCSGTLSEGASVSCTFTFTYVPPPSPGGALLVLLPLAPFPLMAPRRWRSNRAG